ncbi:uncharacterized protein A4U43_C08F13340 [Asparagus officinalis]|nr:uncharacterized protein A4U43_C08F13340 [Asparagus officinalis]
MSRPSANLALENADGPCTEPEPRHRRPTRKTLERYGRGPPEHLERTCFGTVSRHKAMAELAPSCRRWIEPFLGREDDVALEVTLAYMDQFDPIRIKLERTSSSTDRIAPKISYFKALSKSSGSIGMPKGHALDLHQNQGNSIVLNLKFAVILF